MSDASVLKEYLISLGFQIDDGSYKKFQGGLDGITVKAVALGEIIADVAEKVAAGVLKMAQNLDTLYFTSRRVGDSAENISAFGFAISQMGGSAESATASLESLASKMRFYPGLLKMMKGWGIQTTDAKGATLGTSELLVSAGRFWAAQNKRLGMEAGQALGLRQAQLMGIDEKTFLQLSTDPDHLELEMQKYKEMADALGYNVDAANRFETAMRDLKAELGLFASVVALQVMDKLQWLIDKFGELFPGIVQVLGTKEGIDTFADAVIVSLGALALATIAATWPWLLLAAAILGVIEAAKHWNELVPKIKHLTPDEMKKFDADRAKKNAENPYAWYDPRGWIRIHRDTSGDPGSFGEPAKNYLGSSTSKQQQGSRPAMLDQVKAYFMANGFTEAQASGIARGVFAEGGGVDVKNPNSSAYGIGQWLKPRQRDFKRLWGKDIHGSSLIDQLGFMLWEFNNTEKGAGDAIRGAGDEKTAFIHYITKMMRPGAGTAGDLRRGLHPSATRHITMHHKTTIHIDGSKDPKATGAAVATAQERVWANALRGAQSKLN